MTKMMTIFQAMFESFYEVLQLHLCKILSVLVAYFALVYCVGSFFNTNLFLMLLLMAYFRFDFWMSFTSILILCNFSMVILIILTAAFIGMFLFTRVHQVCIPMAISFLLFLVKLDYFIGEEYNKTKEMFESGGEDKSFSSFYYD